MIVYVFLPVVVIYISSIAIHNPVNYEPQYTKISTVYFNNLSTPNEIPKAVADVNIPENSVFFPKCCPPGMSYKTGIKACVKLIQKNRLYEELNTKVNFIQIGLTECDVIVDRFFRDSMYSLDYKSFVLAPEYSRYTKGEFCFDVVADKPTYCVVRTCEKLKYCTRVNGRDPKGLCWRKCCPDGYTIINYSCNLSYSAGIEIHEYMTSNKTADKFAVMHRDCSGNHDEIDLNIYNVTFNTTVNEIVAKGPSNSQAYGIDEYCIYTTENDVGLTKNHFKLCQTNATPNSSIAKSELRLTDIIRILSCIFFILTIGVYIFAYKLKKIVAKLIVCCCVVGLIKDVTYLMQLFFNPEYDYGSFCVHFGYIEQFIVASKLSWRNVLSFEIYRTVGTTGGCINQGKDYFRKLMLYYTTYALVIPCVILSNIVLNYENVYHLPDNAVPIIDVDTCTIQAKEGKYGHLHSYIPNAILAIVNFVLWAKTLVYFLKIKRDLQQVPDSDVYKKKIKSNGTIILKLGIIMGLTCIHTLYYEVSNSKTQVVEDFSIISGVIYYFDGAYFFVIFGIKTKSIKAFWSKLYVSKKKESNTTADDTVQSNEIIMEAVSEPTTEVGT